MEFITILFVGDVMTGRGIDQIMRQHYPPELHEPWVRDAREYVGMAGCGGLQVAHDYIWGEALGEMRRIAPDFTIVNLETAVTADGSPWPRKGIHYRMHPANTACLTGAGIDVCTLANNHVLDWGTEALGETLATLHTAGIATAGAGRDAEEAAAPAVLTMPGGHRLLVFAFATGDCGVPSSWEAGRGPGVTMLHSDAAGLQRAVDRMLQARSAEDIVVASIHWGENWVDDIPAAHRSIARRFIDSGAADVVHGHSSHHPLPAEVYRGKLILYGCGDLINDYEGITTGRSARSDLVCLYAATLDAGNGRLVDLEIVPFRLQRFRLVRAGNDDRRELLRQLEHNASALGTSIETRGHKRWHLAWRT